MYTQRRLSSYSSLWKALHKLMAPNLLFSQWLIEIPHFNTGFPSQWGPNAKLRSTKLSTFSNGVITLWPHRGFWSLSGSPVNCHKGSSAPPPHLRLTSNPPRIVSYRQTLTTVYLQSPMFVWQLHTKFSAQSLKLDIKYSNLISLLLNFYQSW